MPATREQIARLDETIALTRNQLAALLGQGPDRGLAIARPAARIAARRRAADRRARRACSAAVPTWSAQRWRIEAPQQDIADAKAQFYPNVNLAAFIGLQSLGVRGFLNRRADAGVSVPR